MRWSRAFIPTLKEAPKEAEVPSHILMLRAGVMRRLAGGVFTLLPLGKRVLQKVEKIVREELDRIGCQEVLMPILSPAELWRESGRWEVYGKELMRLTDRHEREFALGPTHEEVVTDLVRGELRSYRDLPQTLYQIQAKFRDEIRPRFGVMRGREFGMMDAYSFHADEASLDEMYLKMHEAYTRIFIRCGLRFKPVLADSGAIGGKTTHEFMVLAETGESAVLHCPNPSCDYSATNETAEGTIVSTDSQEPQRPIEEVATPGMKTVEEVCGFLGVPPSKLVKTLLYKAGDRFVAAMVRGDRELNEAKLKNVTECPTAEMADAGSVERLTKALVGFAGPVGLGGVELIADNSIKSMGNFVTGANKTDAHLVNVNLERDFRVQRFADITTIVAGDLCPQCGTALTEYRGIEVGQIFKLGTKYSVAMKATFNAADGTEKPFVMGCYGIGTTRTIAAAIEQCHDDAGIIWPVSIAPYEVMITSLSVRDSEVVETAEKLYNELRSKGVEVLWDDRDERPGVKFKDADLIGIPYRIVVGEKALKQGKVELRERASGEVQLVDVTEVAQVCESKIRDRKPGLTTEAQRHREI